MTDVIGYEGLYSVTKEGREMGSFKAGQMQG